MKKLLLLSFLAFGIASYAQVTPKVSPEAVTSGKSYILVNKAQNASQYTSRTSWDGALYFLGESDSNYANYAFTAIDNGDGTWSFALPVKTTGEEGTEVETNYYMILPQGSPNVNVNSTEPAKWILDKKENNFYNLILGDGNNASAIEMGKYTPTKDIRMHLNAGSQYFCVTYFGGPWYPDCLGGITETEDESTGNVYFQANDSTSFNWGFVQLENVTAYYMDLQATSAINNFYSQYCDIDVYSTGFMTTYNAVATLYNSADYNEEDIDIIKAMINAKVALYNEIEAAIALNEDDDAVLTAAIATAKNTFDNATSASEVESATTVLKNAEASYSMGNGDITSLGTNMSFEDLSAQGGSQTTGIAGAPTGWNVFINGTQVVTAADVTAAGFGGWHGVNDDCAGDIKDGSLGFGIWASSVPDYEISQTIEGLENGTYEITAGLMAGSNGNGSRLTTQRIFGNLNSTYYASEYEYNTSELDQLEVYAFAGNEILTTDRDMLPVTVNAFVYDGTLTFGVRTNNNIAATNRSNSNSAGGDGWFKTDNYKIIKKGYIAADAIDVYNHYYELLQDIDGEPMAASVKAQIKAEENSLGDMSESNTQEEIINGIVKAKDLFVVVNTSVKAYQKLREAIDLHYEYLDQYQNKAGIGDYADAIMLAEDVYNDGTADDEAAIDAEIAKLEVALQTCIQSDDIEEGSDLTEYIVNASFEDLSNQNNTSSSGVVNAPKGWDLYIDGKLTNTAAEIGAAGVTGWCAINEGDNIGVELESGEYVTHQYSDGTHLWGIWNGTIPEIELTQTISGMPAGTYILTCDVLVQYNWAGYCITTQRIYANDYVAMYSYEGNYAENLPADAQAAAAIDEEYPDAEVKHLVYAGHECESPRSDYSHTVSLEFGLAEQGDIKIGFRTNGIASDGTNPGSGKGWFKLDNWTLTYDSFDIPAGAEASGIKNAVTAAENTTVQFYSVNGNRLSSPQKGINIMKMSNGEVKKVLIK